MVEFMSIPLGLELTEPETEPLEAKRFPYGRCRKCQKAIAIPGLDAYKCSGECGWVDRDPFEHLKQQPKKTNRRKKE